MLPIKALVLPALAFVAGILPAAAQSTARPDSIVCRDAEGHVISRSVFSRQGNIETEDRYRPDSEHRHIRIRTVYDSRGNTSSETSYSLDAKAGAWVMDERTDYSHDVLGRMVQKTSHCRTGLHTRTTYSYDASGRLLTEVMLRWNVDDNEWDPVKKYEYAYSYDRMPLDTREYVLRSHYHWASDAEGWVRQSGRESWDYDMRGRVTSRCTQEDNGERDARCTTYDYSPDGLLTEATTTTYETGGVAQAQKETFTYDSDNRVSTHRTYGRDGALASEETHYYAKSPRRPKATREARLDSAVVTSATGEPLTRRVFAYDGKGRRAAICTQTHRLGTWTDSVSVAYTFDATGGKRYENIVIYKAEGQPEIHEILTVRENILDEKGRPAASYAYAANANGDLRLSEFLQYDNTYDAEGRLASAVTIGENGRIDSTAYAYDIVNRYEAKVEDTGATCNLLSRAWMRISGLFARIGAEADTVAVKETVASSAAEKVAYSWNGERWLPREKAVYTFDEYARPRETEHYTYDAQAAAWTPTKKEVFETSNNLTKSRIGYAYNTQSMTFEVSERENLHYY